MMSSLVAAPDRDELWLRIQKIAVKLGFERALVGIEIRRPTLDPIYDAMSGWPEKFQDLYSRKNFVFKDPTVAHCQKYTTTIIWRPEIYTAESVELMEEARLAGLWYGMSVPIHGSQNKVMLSLARDKPLNEDPREERKMYDASKVFAACAHAAMERTVVPEVLAKDWPKLSPREYEIMQYVAQGKGSEVISHLLNLSKPTVEFHVKNAMGKLDCATRVQAACRALSLGLIQ